MNKSTMTITTSAGERLLISGSFKRKGRFLPEGEAELRHPNGRRVAQGNYIDGRPDGPWLSWYEDGSKFSEHSYSNGLLSGPFRQWFRNGQLAISGEYVKGKLHGLVVRNFPDGNKSAEIRYEMGKRKEVRQWFAGREFKFHYHDPLAFIKRSPHAKKVCVVNDAGRTFCRSLDDLARALGQLVDPSDIERILDDGLDIIYSENNLDKQKGLLVSCSGGWDAVDLGTSLTARRSRATPAQLDSMGEACRNLVASKMGGTNGVASADPMASYDDWVTQIIDSADAAFSNCRDSNTSPVKQEQTGVSIEWGNLGSDTDPGTSASERFVLRNIGAPLEDGRIWQHQDHDTDAIAVTLIFVKLAEELAKAAREAQEADAEKQAKEEAADAAARAAEAARINESAGEAPAEEEQKAQQCLPATECTDQNAPAPAPPPPPPPADDGASMPDPDGSSTSCADKQAWWDSVKAYCEKSSWKEYRCQQILRKLNKCVDQSEILPGPDGDATCPSRPSREESERFAREQHCKQLGMISIPSGLGTDNCAELEQLSIPEMDICSDPVAMPNPESDCFGVTVPEITEPGRGPVPSPTKMRRARSRSIEPLSSSGSASLQDQRGLTLLVFSNQSCGPCHRLAMLLDEAAPDYEGRLRIVAVDVKQNRDLAIQHRIHYTPTMILLAGGKPVGQRKVGAVSLERLRRYLDYKIGEAQGMLDLPVARRR